MSKLKGYIAYHIFKSEDFKNKYINNTEEKKKQLGHIHMRRLGRKKE